MEGITLFWVLSQVFTVIEYGLLGASYLAKKRKAIVVLDIFSMICGIVAYLFLGADLGMAMSIVILLANFYYLWEEAVAEKKVKRGKKQGTWEKLKRTPRFWKVARIMLLVVVLGAIAVLTFLNYEGPASLLSVAATTLYEISIWQKSTKVYKFLGIPVAFCWMSYNGVVNSPFGVFCEMIMFVTSVIGYVREVRK